MRANVFRPSFGNRPQTIVGRDALLESVLSGLESVPGDRDRATLMLGQRGMGKTALLLELADRAASVGYVCAKVTAGKAMLDEIIESLQVAGERQMNTARRRIQGFSVGAWGFSAGLTFTPEVQQSYGFRVKLGLICERLAEQGLGVLILVDEVQAKSEEMRHLATTYQHLVGDEADIAICMAGLPSAVSDLLNDEVLTFLNRARKLEIGALALSDVRTYYLRVFTDLGLEISDEALDDAVSGTRGFPYLLQLVGHRILELTAERSVVTSTCVQNAVKAARQGLAETIYLPALRPLSDGDIAFLHAMAEAKGTVKIASLRERLGVSPSYIQTYKRRLMAAGIISSPRRGELAFELPYLGEYLRGEL